MSRGYNNDQWFGLDKAEEGFTFRGNGTSYGRSGYGVQADNPSFRYPDRLVRTEDHNGRKVEGLKRGYIRSLSIGNKKSSKCQFQFNPATLTQSVAGSTVVDNFLLQDPGELVQSMPGNVNFGFDLIFDRSMELNNINRNAANPRANELNPWESRSPGVVGVLSDLSAFFGVIGQGFSAKQRDLVIENYTAQLDASSNGAFSAPSSSGALGAIGTPLSSGTVGGGGIAVTSNLPELLEAQMGNSAFLIPIPVRVVFSGLYIVEGFVTNTTAVFTKFTTNMVPMMASLAVTMDARYIGFAKKKTYLNVQIGSAQETATRQAAAQQEDLRAVYSAFADSASTVDVTVDMKPPGSNFPTTPQDTLINILARASQDSWVFGRFPKVTGDGKDAVSQLYKRGGAPSVSVNSNVRVWGPFPAGSTPAGYSQQQLKTMSAKSRLLYQASTSAQSANTNESWGRLAKLHHSARRSTTTSWEFSTPIAYNPLTSSYIVSISTTVDVSFNGKTVQGVGEVWYQQFPSTSPIYLRRTVPIKWPEYSAPAEDGGPSTVTTDNAATAPKSPGASSTVGQPTRIQPGTSTLRAI